MGEPVFLEADRALDGRLSMTLLRHANMCPRSGFLYRKHGASPFRNVEMVRGTVVHRVFEEATKAMLDQGERRMPPEACKAIVEEILEEHPLPVEEQDYVREQSYRWASQWVLRSDEATVSVERLFVLDIAGYEVRCRVDYASVDPRGALYVADYKSGRGAPNYDDVTRKRPDGSLAAKSFQLIVYALALAFGEPVRVLQDGTEERELPVARGCPEAIMEYVYPGIETGDGTMLRRTMGLTRVEMLEYRESLEHLVRRIDGYRRSGEWPAVVSDAACTECPAVAECPIPGELRDVQGKINSVADAAIALQRRHVQGRLARALSAELRNFVERRAISVRYGDRVAAIVPRESIEIRDREGMFLALEQGMSVQEAREKFVKVSQGTRFEDRDLRPDEYTNNEED